MRAIGFSTGALAKGDFRLGLELQRRLPGLRALELSALREHELPGLVSAIGDLDLSPFDYVSVHAPSRITTSNESDIVRLLASTPRSWPVIVHPEVIQTPALWRALGDRLCIENMDNRKSSGRTESEMRVLLAAFPDAGFCLDLGHAHQIDPTMSTALRMIREFAPRLRQIHLSEVGARGQHLPMSVLAIYAFQLVCDLVPENTPIIIESVVTAEQMDYEARKTQQLFSRRSTQPRSIAGAASILAAAR